MFGFAYSEPHLLTTAKLNRKMVNNKAFTESEFLSLVYIFYSVQQKPFFSTNAFLFSVTLFVNVVFSPKLNLSILLWLQRLKCEDFVFVSVLCNDGLCHYGLYVSLFRHFIDQKETESPI